MVKREHIVKFHVINVWLILDFRIFVLDLISSTGSNDLVLSTERIRDFWLWGFCCLSLQSSTDRLTVCWSHFDLPMDNSISQVRIFTWKLSLSVTCKYVPVLVVDESRNDEDDCWFCLVGITALSVLQCSVYCW